MHIQDDDIKHLEAGFEKDMLHRWNSALEKKLGPPVMVDKSPTYVMLPFVPCRIKKLWPGAKIIIQLRYVGVQAASVFIG